MATTSRKPARGRRRRVVIASLVARWSGHNRSNTLLAASRPTRGRSETTTRTIASGTLAHELTPMTTTKRDHWTRSADLVGGEDIAVGVTEGECASERAVERFNDDRN